MNAPTEMVNVVSGFHMDENKTSKAASNGSMPSIWFFIQ